VAGIFTAVGAASAYLGLIAVGVILVSSMMDNRPDYFGAAVYAMGTAALLGILASTVWALAAAPGDKPLSTLRRVIFTLGTISLVVPLMFLYWLVQ
jgi:hypothetical protein